MAYTRLILILGDQLSLDLSSLRGADQARDIIVMAEVRDEATYIRHHKKKIALIFSAMRHFAEELRTQGWSVDYQSLSDAPENQSLTEAVRHAITRHRPDRIIITEAGEWRLQEILRSWSNLFGLPVDIRPDARFLCSRDDFATWAQGRKQLRMEYFYREMRRKTGLLMQGDSPEGGKWNFDTDNRKPARPDLFLPRPARFEPDAMTQEVLDLVQARFGDHFGDLLPFHLPVTRAEAEQALAQFVDHALPRFGDFQDAMLTDAPFLYHSLLSSAINIGLLNPLEVCRAVERAYYQGHAPLNAAEGFIRQIIGWREYVRGVYWQNMPGYVALNALDHHRDLPEFYWTGKTEMACLRAAITQTKTEAYAHHIQRLMITGNFALLAGVDPVQVHEWYLAVYSDAYEWVELPNTLGMSQFADGGLLGSKPYVASGNYINRMSDYCTGCAFDVKQKTGANACPFNALYWDFMHRHRDRLRKNPRLGPIYRSWDRMDEAKQGETLASAAAFLDGLG